LDRAATALKGCLKDLVPVTVGAETETGPAMGSFFCLRGEVVVVGMKEREGGSVSGMVAKLVVSCCCKQGENRTTTPRTHDDDETLKGPKAYKPFVSIWFMQKSSLVWVQRHAIGL